MGGSTELDMQRTQVNHFSKMLHKLDMEMILLSREQTRQATESKLQTKKEEFDKIGENTSRALEWVESPNFQTLASSSSDVGNCFEAVGVALVTATTNLQKAWTMHCEEQRNADQNRAFDRRVVIRRTRQELWEEKCHVIDGEDGIKDQDITEWEAQCESVVERATRAIGREDEEKTLAPTLAETLRYTASTGSLIIGADSPKSAEILTDISAEISRLEAHHEAAAQTLQMEQEAHARTTAKVFDLQGQIALLEQNLALANKELQHMRAEKARAISGKRKRPTRSKGELPAGSTLENIGASDSKETLLFENESYIVMGSELNELRAAAEELKKEKKAHASTAAKLEELDKQNHSLRPSSSTGDLRKYMMKLKPGKTSRAGLPSPEEGSRALETEKQEHAATMSILKRLEEEMKLKEPLVEVGLRVRHKFLENSKRVFSDGAFVQIRGGGDLEAIKAGNEASFQGNVHADASLYALGYLETKDKPLFEDLYACPVLATPSKALEFPKLTEVFNMRATLGYCSSFTPFTLSETEDSRFTMLEQQCISILSEIRMLPKTTAKGSKEAFEANAVVEEKMDEMRSIVEYIVGLDKRRSGSKLS